MATTYIDERQSETWTSDAIVRFFANLGFEVIKLPIGQIVEGKVPSDFVYFDTHLCKLFGFQFKALYHNGGDFWKLDETQHRTLSDFPWMYYCLSEMKKGNEWREALHFARIVSGTRSFKQKLMAEGLGKPFYYRWAAFYRRLESCDVGVKIESESHLRELIARGSEDRRVNKLVDLAVDVFIADLTARKLAHYGDLERARG